MKTRAKFLLTMTASALVAIAPEVLYASDATAPAHAAPSQSSQPTDTVTGVLIKSVTDLSKTALNLSEAVLKLLNTQNNTQTSTNSERDTVSATVIPDIQTEEPNGVFISSETDVIEAETEQVCSLPAEIMTEPTVPTVSEAPDDKTPNLNELTYWRGDSINMAIPTKRLGRYDRKLYNWLIYPKGLWHIGLTANYGELSTDDSEFLSLITDVDLMGKIYSIKPSVSYFIRHNVCVGMRLALTRGEMGINSFKVDIDEDMSFDLHDISYTSDSYSAAVFLQQYFGLSRRGRFAVFNEVELAYGNGSSHFIRPFDGEMRDTRTKTQSFNINYSPGVSIMMMKNAAFNLSFGIFGFHLKNEKQWENGEESGSRFTSGINFRFNIFNINFGVAIII